MASNRVSQWVRRYYAQELRASPPATSPFYVTDGGVMYARASEILS